MIEIGKRIHMARELRNATLDDIANDIGVAKSTVQRYEKGLISKPKIPVLHSIANSLEVNPAWLVLKSDDMVITYDENSISRTQQRILKYYDSLNSIGKHEAEKRVFELTQIPLYSAEPLVNAAHEIPGSSEEDKAHDEEIMNSDDWDD